MRSFESVQKLIAQIEVDPGGYAYCGLAGPPPTKFRPPRHPLFHQSRDLSALPQVMSALAAHPLTRERWCRHVAAASRRQVLARMPDSPVRMLVLVERPLADAYAPLALRLSAARHLLLGLGLSLLASLSRPPDGCPDPCPPGRAADGAGDLGIVSRSGPRRARASARSSTGRRRSRGVYAASAECDPRTRECGTNGCSPGAGSRRPRANPRAISISPTNVHPFRHDRSVVVGAVCGMSAPSSDLTGSSLHSPPTLSDARGYRGPRAGVPLVSGPGRRDRARGTERNRRAHP